MDGLLTRHSDAPRPEVPEFPMVAGGVSEGHLQDVPAEDPAAFYLQDGVETATAVLSIKAALDQDDGTPTIVQGRRSSSKGLDPSAVIPPPHEKLQSQVRR